MALTRKLTTSERMRIKMLLKKFKIETKKGFRDINRLLKPRVKTRKK